ncbi:trypsin-like peptidase domain-containing protein [Neolewinella persica]|uniref:trypsin-like peptidase domain-containing protein n=1 Tax=Neolewinella persica TaxID=70998 RepID=UPI0003A5A0C2|nr:trypsin-like peptidase domain-containing protein [Neolewinella persica]
MTISLRPGFLSLLLALLAFPILLPAQLSEPLRPKSQVVNLSPAVKEVVMPGIDMPAIQLEDKREDKFNQPTRFAFPFPVNLGFKDGTWTNLPNGDRVWRLSIKAPGAQGMTLLYDRFFLPPGATLHLSNPYTNELLGAFTEKNNNEVKRFATGIVLGDITVLEYYEPASQRGRGALNVVQVGHAYRMMGELKGLNDSGPCQVNVNCEEGADWQDEKRGVAHYTVNGTATCSGSLINNTAQDATPYFLTADHCIGNLDALGNMDASGYVFYWDYERAGCTNTGPVPTNTTAGATLVANNVDSDFALFRLTESPNIDFMPYFNGWSAEQTPIRGGVGIHHPALDAKKIATHSMVPTNSSVSSVVGNFWRILWDATPNGHSVTEGGSSGSALFNSESRIIGQLFGGSFLNCDDPANDQGLYGKIAYSWDADGATNPGRRLRDWLDPANTGVDVLDGAYIVQPPPTVGFANALLINNTSFQEGSNALDALPGDCRPYTDYPVTITASYTLSDPFTAVVGASGSALNENDYTIFPSTVTLTPNNSSETITLRIFDDFGIEDTEQIDLVVTGTGANASIGSNNQLSFGLEDNDQPIAATRLAPAAATDFNAGIPADWPVVNNGSTTMTWMNVPNYDGGNNMNGTSFIIVDSDAPGQGTTTNETITTPVKDLSASTNIVLSFDQYFRAYNQGGFETATVSVFDGTSWIDVYNLDQDSGNVGSWANPDQQNLDLSAFANDAFQVRFRYTGAYDWWWALDNIELVSEESTTVLENVTEAPLEIYLDAFTTVGIINPENGELLLEIENLTSTDHGCTNVFLDRVISDGADTYPLFSNFPSNAVMARAVRIEPANSSENGSFRLRYFLGENDLSGWTAATGAGLGDAGIIQLAGVSVLDVNPGNFAAQTSSWYPITEGFLGTNQYLETEINGGFGGFAIGRDPENSSLPVTWLSFTGRNLSEKANELNWATSEEVDNDRFELEVSPNGRDFQYVGTVAASTSQAYTFVHEQPFSGDNYYRLRQVDVTETYSFSEVINVVTPFGGLGRVLVSPVRAGVLSLSVREDVQSVELIDAAGRQVKAVQLASGHASIINVGLPGHLAAGVYFVRFVGDGEIFADRVVIR